MLTRGGEMFSSNLSTSLEEQHSKQKSASTLDIPIHVDDRLTEPDAHIKLWRSVLVRAIDDIFHHEISKSQFLELLEWFYDDRKAPGTVRWICDILGIPIRAVHKGIFAQGLTQARLSIFNIQLDPNNATIRERPSKATYHIVHSRFAKGTTTTLIAFKHLERQDILRGNEQLHPECNRSPDSGQKQDQTHAR